MRNFLVLLLVGLVVYTIVDVTRSEPEERFRIPHAIWIILIIVTAPLGSIAWLALSRSVRNRPDGPTRDGGRRSPTPPPQLGPDDDPEFLWRLEQRQREADRNAPSPKPTDDDDSDQNPADPRGTTP